MLVGYNEGRQIIGELFALETSAIDSLTLSITVLVESGTF